MSNRNITIAVSQEEAAIIAQLRETQTYNQGYNRGVQEGVGLVATARNFDEVQTLIQRSKALLKKV